MEKIFDAIGVSPTAKKCDAMQGILKETNNLIKEIDIGWCDRRIIAADQKVKH